jgi:hypothetical protein
VFVRNTYQLALPSHIRSAPFHRLNLFPVFQPLILFPDSQFIVTFPQPFVPAESHFDSSYSIHSSLVYKNLALFLNKNHFYLAPLRAVKVARIRALASALALAFAPELRPRFASVYSPTHFVPVSCRVPFTVPLQVKTLAFILLLLPSFSESSSVEF